MRWLAIDPGTKRIGLAVGSASPVKSVPAEPRTAALADIKAAVEAYGVGAIVVGLPLNMDDSEGAQAKIARAFGQRIADATGKPVHYCDERLSTVEALALLVPAGLTRKKKKARVDRVAAQVMLQAFLDGVE